jgi:hypothetical protein
MDYILSSLITWAQAILYNCKCAQETSYYIVGDAIENIKSCCFKSLVLSVVGVVCATTLLTYLLVNWPNVYSHFKLQGFHQSVATKLGMLHGAHTVAVRTTESSLPSIDAERLLHVLAILHDQLWIIRPIAPTVTPVRALQFTVDTSVKDTAAAPEDGLDATLLLKAAERAVKEGWLIAPMSLSSSVIAHTFVQQHLTSHLHLNAGMSVETVLTLIKRAPINQLTLDMLGHTDTTLYGVVIVNMVKFTRLRRFELKNFRNDHAAELLCLIDQHCLNLDTIILSQNGTAQQQQVLHSISEGVERSNSAKVLALINVNWTGVLPSTPAVLNIIGADCTAMQLPASVQQLTAVNTQTLPTLNKGLMVLDLVNSEIPQFGYHAIPSTVQHLKLPRTYTHAFSVPLALQYLCWFSIQPSTS